MENQSPSLDSASTPLQEVPPISLPVTAAKDAKEIKSSKPSKSASASKSGAQQTLTWGSPRGGFKPAMGDLVQEENTDLRQKHQSKSIERQIYAVFEDPLSENPSLPKKPKGLSVKDRVGYEFSMIPLILELPAVKQIGALSTPHPIIPLLRKCQKTNELSLIYLACGPLKGWNAKLEQESLYPYQTCAFDLSAEVSTALLMAVKTSKPDFMRNLHQRATGLLWKTAFLFPGEMFCDQTLPFNNLRGLLSQSAKKSLKSTLVFLQLPPWSIRRELGGLAGCKSKDAQNGWEAQADAFDIEKEWLGVKHSSLPQHCTRSTLRQHFVPFIQDYVDAAGGPPPDNATPVIRLMVEMLSGESVKPKPQKPKPPTTKPPPTKPVASTGPQREKAPAGTSGSTGSTGTPAPKAVAPKAAAPAPKAAAPAPKAAAPAPKAAAAAPKASVSRNEKSVALLEAVGGINTKKAVPSPASEPKPRDRYQTSKKTESSDDEDDEDDYGKVDEEEGEDETEMEENDGGSDSGSDSEVEEDEDEDDDDDEKDKNDVVPRGEEDSDDEDDDGKPEKKRKLHSGATPKDTPPRYKIPKSTPQATPSPSMQQPSATKSTPPTGLANALPPAKSPSIAKSASVNAPVVRSGIVVGTPKIKGRLASSIPFKAPNRPTKSPTAPLKSPTGSLKSPINKIRTVGGTPLAHAAAAASGSGVKRCPAENIREGIANLSQSVFRAARALEKDGHLPISVVNGDDSDSCYMNKYSAAKSAINTWVTPPKERNGQVFGQVKATNELIASLIDIWGSTVLACAKNGSKNSMSHDNNTIAALKAGLDGSHVLQNILPKMEAQARGFEELLAEAQRLAHSIGKSGNSLANSGPTK